jgi:hypothetical protein
MSKIMKIDIKPIMLLSLPRKDGKMLKVGKKTLSPSTAASVDQLFATLK